MSKKTVLQSFLSHGANSRSRERMFFHRLYFDLKLAAAQRGYHLGLSGQFPVHHRWPSSFRSSAHST
jgi:hypothetical protein